HEGCRRRKCGYLPLGIARRADSAETRQRSRRNGLGRNVRAGCWTISSEAQRQQTMTGPDDSHSNTRPISVAELLARNGTIGAPPVGGRRRRRRGNNDSVTVAELTGEIPIVAGHQADENETTHTIPAVTDEPAANGV